MCGSHGADQQRPADRVEFRHPVEFEHLGRRQFVIDRQFVVRCRVEFVDRQFEFVVGHGLEFLERIEFVIERLEFVVEFLVERREFVLGFLVERLEFVLEFVERLGFVLGFLVERLEFVVQFVGRVVIERRGQRLEFVVGRVVVRQFRFIVRALAGDARPLVRSAVEGGGGLRWYVVVAELVLVLRERAPAVDQRQRSE